MTNRKISDDELQSIKVDEAAKLLGQSVSQVRKLITEHKIIAFNSGRSLRIRRTKLLDYIEQKEAEKQW